MKETAKKLERMADMPLNIFCIRRYEKIEFEIYGTSEKKKNTRKKLEKRFRSANEQYCLSCFLNENTVKYIILIMNITMEIIICILVLKKS